jgi:protein phosphatase
VDDLKQVARGTVTAGILGLQSKQQAEAVIERLRTDQMLPACPKPGTTGTTKPGSSGQAGTPTTTPKSTPVKPPGTTTRAVPPIGGGAGTAAHPTTTSTTPTTSHPQIPGVDCRKAGN